MVTFIYGTSCSGRREALWGEIISPSVSSTGSKGLNRLSSSSNATFMLQETGIPWCAPSTSSYIKLNGSLVILLADFHFPPSCTPSARFLPFLAVFVSCQLNEAVRAPRAPERCAGQVSNVLRLRFCGQWCLFIYLFIYILWGRMSWDARSNTRSLSHTALIISAMFPFKKHVMRWHWSMLPLITV